MSEMPEELEKILKEAQEEAMSLVEDDMREEQEEAYRNIEK